MVIDSADECKKIYQYDTHNRHRGGIYIKGMRFIGSFAVFY